MQAEQELRWHAVPVPEDEVGRIFGRSEEEFEAKVAAGLVGLFAVSQGVVMEIGTNLVSRQRHGRAQMADGKVDVCRVHVWAFDDAAGQRRHCTRPGCAAKQKWEWRPEDASRQGEWVDAVVAEKRKQRERRVATKRHKRTQKQA
jgi:hypothetical protein